MMGTATVEGTHVTVGSTRPRDPLLWITAAVCGLLVFVAALGALLAPYPPDQTDILAAGQGPSAEHWLGTDALGRDILSRALVGARLSFLGPGLIVLGSALVGTAIALYSAWNGNWVDRSVNRGLTLMLAVPGILVAVLAAAVFGAGFWAPVIALTLVYIPYFARVTRSAAVRERHMPYVEGLEVAGFSPWRICTRHLLRNISPIVIAQATILFGVALLDFAAVSFLGLGVQPPAAEWGLMVADGRTEILNGDIQQSLVAGMCIIVTVVAFNILGERLSSRFGAGR
jgi:peptide/nickel transport system permease protein